MPGEILVTTTTNVATGDDGTVSFTLMEGDVTYVAKTASTTAFNSSKVDPGTAISKQYLKGRVLSESSSNKT
ncbi:MAG: hypothetical protein P4L69_23900 [Desulfosporosinus sp.]|nr:hypothetical protein [Desulfosporosinus sp.]